MDFKDEHKAAPYEEVHATFGVDAESPLAMDSRKPEIQEKVEELPTAAVPPVVVQAAEEAASTETVPAPEPAVETPPTEAAAEASSETAQADSTVVSAVADTPESADVATPEPAAAEPAAETSAVTPPTDEES